jgi:hypothetical protein
LKDALAGGRKLPTELKKDAQKLGKDLAFDEAQTGINPSLTLRTIEAELTPCRSNIPYRQ